MSTADRKVSDRLAPSGELRVAINLSNSVLADVAEGFLRDRNAGGFVARAQEASGQAARMAP